MFKQEPVANRAEINGVTLLEFPNQNFGSSWDSFGGAPDVYIELYVGSVLKMTGSVVDNAVSPTSISWTPNETIRVDNLNETIDIYVYDSDAITDEYMTGISFNLDSYKTNEPSIQQLEVSDCKIQLSLDWLYKK